MYQTDNDNHVFLLFMDGVQEKYLQFAVDSSISNLLQLICQYLVANCRYLNDLQATETDIGLQILVKVTAAILPP